MGSGRGRFGAPHGRFWSGMAYFWLLFISVLSFSAFAGEGICERSRSVQQGVLNALDGGSCELVTEADLAGIQEIVIWDQDGPFKTSDFAGLTSLTRLEVTESNVVSIQAGLLSDMSQLTRLMLNRVGIESIDPTAFQGLKNLGAIHLSGNFLKSLDRSLLFGLTSLDMLDLSANQLESLPEGFFKGTRLEWLYLDRNLFTSIPERAALKRVERINLSENPITDIPDGQLAGFEFLELDLTGALTEIRPGLLRGVLTDGVITLGGPSLSKIHDGAFAGFRGQISIDERSPLNLTTRAALSGISLEQVTLPRKFLIENSSDVWGL